jgi:hypothetical protein
MASDWRPVVYPAFLRSLLRHVRRLERDAVAHLDELERQAMASEVPAICADQRDADPRAAPLRAPA